MNKPRSGERNRLRPILAVFWPALGQTYTIATSAGSGGYGFSGDNGPAGSAALYQPGGVAVDSSGTIYIADTNNNRIRKVSNGVITTIAGNGTNGFSGDGGPATSAMLSGPNGIAVDSAGNITSPTRRTFASGKSQTA